MLLNLLNRMGSRSAWRRITAAAVILVLLLALGGCRAKTEQPAPGVGPGQTGISPEPTESKEKLSLYFGDQDAMYLVLEEREVVKGSKSLETVIIEELTRGPVNQGLQKTIPQEAKLLSVNVVDGVAYLNFSREFQSKHPGGTAGEIMTLYSITNSLAKLPGIEKVQFLLAGEKQESILGHMDTSRPIEPDWNLVKN